MTRDTSASRKGSAAAEQPAPSSMSRIWSLFTLRTLYNWPVRIRLIAVAAVPTATALTLGGLRIASAWGGGTFYERAEPVIIALLVIALGLAVAVVVALSMTRPLETLRTSALDVAENRLPGVVRRLQDSDGRDVDVTAERVGVQSTDEIGQVARAFDEVHSEAVRLASEQARLRTNVDAMFVNLSRRSQSLVERQLGLIDELENGEQDADQLAHLFKLDHLATRMRRHGENLLVLAGERSGRRWSEPVPLLGVLRAAISEVEQYGRIQPRSAPDAELSAPAVKDTVHLLAELLENATAYSPGDSTVVVTMERLGDGRVTLEITDGGIGMGAEEIAAANERLATRPVVDVSVSRHMGLFVVGRLAWRHGIRVRLRTPDEGGVCAQVTLPRGLVTVRGGPTSDSASTTTNSSGGTGARPYTVSGVGSGGDVTESEHASSGGPPAGPRASGAQANGQPGGETGATAVSATGSDSGSRRGAAEGEDVFAEPPFFSRTEHRERLPIFDATRSDWFSETARTAEEAIASPASNGVTSAGLPRRVPGRNFVPGSAGAPETRVGAHAASREPDAVGGRLASYHRGIRRGRHASREESASGGSLPADGQHEEEDA